MRPLIAALLVLISVQGPSTARAQPVPPAGEPVLARAGDVFISEREFLERFELTPGLYRHRKADLGKEKLEFLLSMIAEKLLVQEAVERGLDRDENTRRAAADITRMFARDELYRREVREKVSVSEGEINEGIARSRTIRLVRFVYCESEEEALFLRGGVTSARALRELSVDSSMRVIQDTASVLWGDADPAVEEAAYALKPGEISPVVGAGDGWYLLALVSSRPNPAVGKLPASTLRQRVEGVVRGRKERVRMEEFLRELKGRHAVYSPGEPFSALARTLADVLGGDNETLTPSAARLAMERLHDRLADTVLVAGERGWSIGEAIQLLTAKGFVVRGSPERRTGRRLYEALGEWADHEVTEEEAVRRGLDRLPQVQQAVEPWRDAYLAGRMKAALDGRARVSDAEVAAYLRNVDTAWGVPMVRLRELRTSTLEQMREAFRSLEDGASFESVVRRYSTDPRARADGGLTEAFPITERRPLGEIAWRLSAGERYGPVRDSAGVLMFEVVEKSTQNPQGDSARFAGAAAELRRMKQRRLTTLFIAQAASRRGVDVFQDRLTQLDVSPIPMLAFRLLGFGGRMFAVPFVDPQLDWLDVEPPKETILP